MNMHLIDIIKKAFYTEDVLLCNTLVNYDNSKNTVHWEEIYLSRKDILDNISDWYLNDKAFKYLLPGCLIYFLTNDLKNSETLLFFMSRFQPDENAYGDCTYFNNFFELTQKQRHALFCFFKTIRIKDCQSEISSACRALTWFERKSTLELIIHKYFPSEPTLKYAEIANTDESENKSLCSILENTRWDEKDTANKIDELLSTLEYYQLSDKAFIYFIPTCLLISLSEVPGYHANNTNQTINLLCMIKKSAIANIYSIKKYSLLSKQQQKVISIFLKSYLRLGYYHSEMNNRIVTALTGYWLKK